MCIYIYIYLFIIIYLSIYLSIYLFIYLSLYLWFYEYYILYLYWFDPSILVQLEAAILVLNHWLGPPYVDETWLTISKTSSQLGNTAGKQNWVSPIHTWFRERERCIYILYIHMFVLFAYIIVAKSWYMEVSWNMGTPNHSFSNCLWPVLDDFRALHFRKPPYLKHHSLGDFNSITSSPLGCCPR